MKSIDWNLIEGGKEMDQIHRLLSDEILSQMDGP